MDDELQDETEEDFEGHLPPIFPRSRAELPCLHLGSVPRLPLPSHSAHLDIHSVDVHLAATFTSLAQATRRSPSTNTVRPTRVLKRDGSGLRTKGTAAPVGLRWGGRQRGRWRWRGEGGGGGGGLWRCSRAAAPACTKRRSAPTARGLRDAATAATDWKPSARRQLAATS